MKPTTAETTMMDKLVPPLRDLLGRVYVARVLSEIFEYVLLVHRRFICSELPQNFPNFVISPNRVGIEHILFRPVLIRR
jgi:hypothetical protein